MKYSIISYNVNGIRSATTKGMLDWKRSVDPDIVCFQELKALPDDLGRDLRSPEGYKTYWFPAEKKGYSGVAIFSKIEPLHVEYGCGMPQYDREGRVLRLDFPEFSLLNVYLPSGSSGEERQALKELFMADFYSYVQELLKSYPRLVICGDLNICHKPIDIHNPVSNKDSSGFLPHERAWLSEFMDLGLNDSFRMFHEEPHRYSWWSFRAGARGNNKGWRIDYHLVSDAIKEYVTDANIFEDAKHSDHAPVFVRLEF